MVDRSSTMRSVDFNLPPASSAGLPRQIKDKDKSTRQEVTKALNSQDFPLISSVQRDYFGNSLKSRNNEGIKEPVSSILKTTQRSLSTTQVLGQSVQKIKMKKSVNTKKEVNWRNKQNRMFLYQMQQRFEFNDIRKHHQQELIYYHGLDNKGPRKTLYLKQVMEKNDLILNVVEQSPLELLMNYEDRWPLLNFRKSINRANLYVKNFAQAIITNKVFETTSILVILANSITLAMEDPQAVKTTAVQDAMETLFLGLYTTEMVLKIMGLGFLFSGKRSYLRDPWNMLDFTIVMSAYLTIVQDLVAVYQNDGQKIEMTVENADQGGLSLNSLRAFRVLRPLRAITSIKGLQVLVTAVLASLPLLKETIMVLLSFFLVFAIAGTQLLSGVLKQRCVNIEDGTNFDDEYICGSRNNCPDGYFCGKQNGNPNYGVTNLDNLMYALLVVFQCITLEGWSDIMVQFQMSYSNFSFILFLPVVFIGAFFLVNLTLAVINSSFSVTHKAQQVKIAAQKAKLKLIRKKPIDEDNYYDDEGPPDQIGINQYWVAQRASKKMLAQLKAAMERKKALAKAEGLFGLETQAEDPDAEAKLLEQQLQRPPPPKKDNQEDDEEEDFSVQVLNFLDDNLDEDLSKPKINKRDLTKEIKHYAINEMRVANRINKKLFKKTKGQVQDIETNDAKQLAVKLPEIAKHEYRGPMADFKALDDLLNITDLLQKADNQDLSQSSFMHPFDLSQNHSQAIDYADDSENEDLSPRQPKEEKFKNLLDLTNESDEMSSVIASDSSFEHRLEQLDEDKEDKQLLEQANEKMQISTQGTERILKQKTQLVSKKNSSQNDNLLKVEGADPDAPPIEIIDEEPTAAQKKKKKKKLKCKKSKATGPESKYKMFRATIEGIDKTFVGQKRSKNPYDFINKKTHKIEILPGLPYMSTSSVDVFEIRNAIGDATAMQDANKFVKANYVTADQEEIKIQELLQEYTKPVYDAYQLKTCYQIQIEEQVDFDEDDDDALILSLQPYDTVMSVGYGHLLTHRPIKFIARRSDIIVSSTLQLTLTPSDSGYRPLDHALLSRDQIFDWCNLRHQFRAIDSYTAGLYKDPVIIDATAAVASRTQTSLATPAGTKFRRPYTQDFSDDDSEVPFRRVRTTNINLFKRGKTGEISRRKGMTGELAKFKSNSIKPATFAEKSPPRQQVASRLGSLNDSIEVWEQKETQKILSPTRPPEQEAPYQRMIPQTLLTAPLVPEKTNMLNEEEKRLYNIQKGKYDSYQRILQKKEQQGEHPKNRVFTFAETQMLMLGAHHDDEEEEDLIDTAEIPMNYLGREDNFKQQKLEQFENAARQILRKKTKVTRGKHEYIPKDVRIEFDLPDDLGDDGVNFTEVIKADCNRKRKTPMWSGQDVLQIGLTTQLSQWVIHQINAVRVWPKGVANPLKKARALLKMIVKSDLFNNSMTLCVLLNTVAMGMERYNLDQATIDSTEQAGEIFTWIFIVEMTSKIIAVGPRKYLLDKMNWLDGGVVSLSIVEIVMSAVGGSGGNLSAFRTIRVFRTFRVLRVARLLRALKSMQVILAVITRSASSFVYITLLMFVFIFIYTLLGMQVFGGQFNFEDGKPRGNYDSFIIAFLTVFQVLTTENWNSVLFDSMRSERIGLYMPVMYYVSWIFIGNFILLNLFLAILLDGFLAEDDEEEGDQEEIQRIEAENRKIKIEKEKIRRLKKMGADVNYTGNAENQAQKRKNLEEFVDDVDDMDEQTIREIFMDQGLIKKKDKEREARLMYQGIECERALYLFTKDNPVRLFLYKLQKHKLFDQVVMSLIAMSSLKLAADSYLVGFGPESKEIQISDNIDIFMNVSFLMECVVKNIALGNIMDSGSYLRETWNQLDMFIVATSVLDMALTNVDLPVIKILRLLRTLRPLRVISHNVAMKLIVASLFESVGAIFNVMIVVVAVWLMFAIFAINIFAGKFFYCSIAPFTYHTKYECNINGGSWLRAAQNFDDIFQAMLTLFNVASLEGWPDVMLYALDSTDVDQGPEQEASVINGFFFIVFILIGSFFLMNFFTGVLFLKYSQAAKNETVGYTVENLVWIDIQKMIVEQRCPHDLMNKPDKVLHPKRFKYWKIVTSTPFDLFIMAVIVLNIVQMGINFENAPLLYVQLLGISDYFFTVIFVVEAYLKLRAYSFRYFDTLSNKFDAFIVVSSLIDIMMGFMSKEASESFSLGPQLARMMRVMRVTRVVRLAGKNEGLQALMQTITLSVGALANVFLLLMLVLFIFSILAVFFFSDLNEGNVIDEYRNFNNFGQSFLFLFVISTGENWNMVMYDCNKTPPGCEPGKSCGTSFAPLFFIIFVLFVQNVMLNLFILVIINQFEKYYMSDDNPISKFKKNLDVFMVTWVDFTATKSRCIKLREKLLTDFFKKLPMPIGLPSDTDEDQMKKIMLKMGIKCDDGYIYFNELLYRCMRRQYGSFKLNKKMQIHELKTQYKIYMLKLAAQSLYLQKIAPHEIFFAKTVGNGKSVNPFLQEMYYNISFNTWLNYARKMQKRERFAQKQEVKRQSCWAQGIEFVPGFLNEPKQEVKYVQIEVEEIHYVTTEGEQSSSEEDIPVVKNRVYSLAQLKKKKTCKPMGGISAGKKMAKSYAPTQFTTQQKGYGVLELLKLHKRKRQKDVVSVKGSTSLIMKLNTMKTIMANARKHRDNNVEDVDLSRETFE